MRCALRTYDMHLVIEGNFWDMSSSSHMKEISTTSEVSLLFVLVQSPCLLYDWGAVDEKEYIADRRPNGQDG